MFEVDAHTVVASMTGGLLPAAPLAPKAAFKALMSLKSPGYSIGVGHFALCSCVFFRLQVIDLWLVIVVEREVFFCQTHSVAACGARG